MLYISLFLKCMTQWPSAYLVFVKVQADIREGRLTPNLASADTTARRVSSKRCSKEKMRPRVIYGGGQCDLEVEC
jgi:hypothetical protein